MTAHTDQALRFLVSETMLLSPLFMSDFNPFATAPVPLVSFGNPEQTVFLLPFSMIPASTWTSIDLGVAGSTGSVAFSKSPAFLKAVHTMLVSFSTRPVCKTRWVVLGAAERLEGGDGLEDGGGYGGSTIVFAWPSIFRDASILIVMGAGRDGGH